MKSCVAVTGMVWSAPLQLMSSWSDTQEPQVPPQNHASHIGLSQPFETINLDCTVIILTTLLLKRTWFCHNARCAIAL
jgi:hypothetical protein